MVEGDEDLQLSLHALWGKEGPQIMRIRGSCKKRPLRILIDTGSTHNFSSNKVARRIKGEKKLVTPRAVEVANGQVLLY